MGKLSSSWKRLHSLDRVDEHALKRLITLDKFLQGPIKMAVDVEVKTEEDVI